MCSRPAGNRVIVQTHSGGPGAAAADASSRAGLELPPLSEKTLAKIAPMVPHTGSVNNPIDVTYSKNPMDFFEAIPDALMQDNGADGLLTYFLAPEQSIRRTMIGMGVPEEKIPRLTEQLYEDQGRMLAELIKKHQKPLVGFSFQSHQDLFIQKLLHHGVPVLPSPERASRAMAALVRYARIFAQISSI
jgi:acyl-CoA synthetase (NDP forming)